MVHFQVAQQNSVYMERDKERRREKTETRKREREIEGGEEANVAKRWWTIYICLKFVKIKGCEKKRKKMFETGSS